MKFLLDTHVFLWSVAEPQKLHPKTRAAIADRKNDVQLSIASIWEIAIKYGLGKLTLPLPPGELFGKNIEALRIRVLPISAEHALAVAQLPRVHADPFDRMLIAQATLDNLIIVTSDAAFKKYSAPLWNH